MDQSYTECYKHLIYVTYVIYITQWPDSEIRKTDFTIVLHLLDKLDTTL